MADTAAPKPKLTLAALQEELARVDDTAAAAMDGVERLNKQVVDAQEGLPQNRLDGFLARLEKVEQNQKGVTYDWKPAIDTLVAADNTLTGQISDLAKRVTAAEEVIAPEQGGLLDEVWGALEALRQSVDERLQQERAAAPVVHSMRETSSGVGGVGGKVLALMHAVDSIGKNRKAEIENRQGQDFSYKFRGIDDAMDAVGHGMRQVGLIMRTEVIGRDYHLTPVSRKFANGGESTQLWSTSVLTMRYTFVDPADMSELSFEMVGEGKDSSDKASSKAASMACKYALFQALMIPVKGMEESDGQNPQITADTDPPAQPAPPQQPPAQAEPPVSQEAKVTRAVAAVDAAKVLHTLPDAKDAMRRLEGISERVKQEGLADISVGDLTVGQWITSVWKVLKGLMVMESKPTDQGATRSDVDPGAPAATRAQQDRESYAQRPQDPAPAQHPVEPPADDPWGSYTPPGES